MDLEQLEGLLDQVSQQQHLTLAVVDLVADAYLAPLKDVEHRQNLPEVRNQRLAHRRVAAHEHLEDLQRDRNNFGVPRIQSILDVNDQSGQDGRDSLTARIEEVNSALHGKEAVGLVLLPDSLNKHGQVAVQIHLLDVYLPVDLVGRLVLDRDREVAAVVVLPKVGLLNSARTKRTRNWPLWHFLGR